MLKNFDEVLEKVRSIEPFTVSVAAAADTPHVLEIMRNIKRAFDPNNILNPGVIVDL